MAFKPSLLSLVVLVAASSAHGACVRHDVTAIAGKSPPEFDGPGSFGVLQDTVTLDCLTYVGSIQQGKMEHVLVRDERGVVHSLGIGDFVGENTGVIVKLDAQAIYIEQTIKRNGKPESVIVRFSRSAARPDR